MANPIQSLIPNFFAVDVVGVYTPDFKQVFKAARPVKAIVKETSKLMDHPVENGTVVTDHRVLNPTEIEIPLMLTAENYADTYKEIKKYYIDGTKLTVQTKVDNYENMLIWEMPHEESAGIYSAAPVAMKLRQVVTTTAQFGIVPADPANLPVVDRGTISAKVPSADKISVANDVYGRFVQ